MLKALSLLITLIVGLLFLIGVFIIKVTNHKKQIIDFSLALAFSVIICLLLVDIMPEIYESFSLIGINYFVVNTLGFMLLGILILKMLDYFIPDHHHDHHDDETNIDEHNNHLYHIGFITSIAIILHNIMEGFAIYTLSIADLKMGILMGLGVGLHNIPMGMEISTLINSSSTKKNKKYITYFLICFSTLVGGFIGLLFKNIDSLIVGILLSITAGMLIYIAFFELFKEIKKNIKSKYTIFGLISGCILMLLTLMF